MAYNLKSIKEEFKQKGIFYTPPELAQLLKSYIDFEPKEVYDPTCGDGGLLAVFDDDVIKYGQEINEEQLEVAKERLVNFNGVCGDTLKDPAFKDKKFECIIANPPFSINWEPKDDKRFNGMLAPKSKADYAFILHILHYLSDNGIAVVLEFPGILYRGNSEGKIRKWLIENNYIEKVISIPGDTFIDTKIQTCLLIIKKNKIDNNIEFEDRQLNIKRKVLIDEIKNNDYNLSVNSYIREKKEEILINPLELQIKARKGFINRLKSELEFDKMVCKMENYNFNDYLEEIQNVINNFKI